MIKYVINYFEEKNQNRIEFVQLLNDTLKIGLKESKMLMDNMLDGNPIIANIHRDFAADFESHLVKMKVNFEKYPLKHVDD
jgi:hypothetical protein